MNKVTSEISKKRENNFFFVFLPLLVSRLQRGSSGSWPSRHRLRRVRERDPIRGRQRCTTRLQDHAHVGHEDLLRQEMRQTDINKQKEENFLLRLLFFVSVLSEKRMLPT